MVVPTADRSKATVLVKVRFLDNDSRILPEMSAKVAFLSRDPAPADLKPKVGIPRTVISEREGRKVVYAVREGRAVKVPIAIGVALGDMVEVTTGLKGGEKIVARPLDRVQDGMRITTTEK
jgi:multidrug efflux pump subunit AcrA (membrane-fusion protein)